MDLNSLNWKTCPGCQKVVTRLATQVPGPQLTASPGHSQSSVLGCPHLLIKYKLCRGSLCLHASVCVCVCVCVYVCVCVCIISKFTESTIYQDKMFPCFLHELYRAGLCCAFCYFCKAVLQSLFSFSTFVGIIT